MVNSMSRELGQARGKAENAIPEGSGQPSKEQAYLCEPQVRSAIVA